MVTVAHLTKKLLLEKPYVHEALAKDLINIGALAEMLSPSIEKELGKVKISAISMAIRRYVEKNKKEFYHKVNLSAQSNLLVKNNLFELSVLKSHSIYSKLMKLYSIVDFSQGDTLNIIQGNYEILIVSNLQYEKKFLTVLKGEKVKNTKKGLSSLSITIPKECLDVPGFYFSITKALAMENVPIIDIVNTETEATMILFDKDVSKAYEILQKEINIEYYKR